MERQKKQLCDITNHDWPHHRLVTSHCPPLEATKKAYLPGGVVQIAHGRHCGRISNHFSDPIGRWSGQTFLLPHNQHITIITAYRPCLNPITPTSKTIVTQQTNHLKKKGIHIHPRKIFLRDLTKTVLKENLQGNYVIIALDANLTKPDIEFENFLQICNLSDFHYQIHQTIHPTHKKGNRLDLFVGTTSLLQHITASGVLPVSKGAISDHAPIFMDITSLFFKNEQDPVKPDNRLITSKQKRSFEKMGERINTAVCQDTMLAKLLAQLETSNNKERCLNLVDDRMTKILLKEYNRFSRKPAVIAWSPQYKESYIRMTELRKALRIYRKHRKLTIPIPSHIPTNFNGIKEYLNQLLKTATIELRDVTSKAEAHRNSFLHRKLKQAQECGDIKAIKRFRNIINSENKRQSFRYLTSITKNQDFTPLDRIHKQMSDGTIQEITSSEDMFTSLRRNNLQHFNQATSTPLTKPPLQQIFPPFELSEVAVDQILHGDLSSLPNLNSTHRKLLRMIPTSDVTQISDEMTNKLFIQGIKKIPEGKTSSMSGRNYSIYKSILPHEKPVTILVTIINYCKNNSIILKRWKKILQVMLCKSRGNYLLHKLRIIQLLEADLNMYLRLVWGKLLVRNILKHDLFPQEQGGNKPGHQGTSSAVLKVLSFDQIRLLRAQACIFNNDAKACYDRIIASFSQLCCIRLGLSKKAAIFMLKLLNQAQYFVRTIFGIDKQHYSNLLLIIYGVLQGSGSAPAIWLAVSILLINTYNKEFLKGGISNPTKESTFSKVLDAFVDDTDLWDVILKPVSVSTMEKRINDRANFWNSLLSFTGGQLNYEKCFWYMISWKWDSNGLPQMKTIQESPAEIHLRDLNNNQVLIQRKETTDSLKTLGIHTSPSGTSTAAYKATVNYLTEMTASIKQHKISHADASLLIPVYIHSRLRYTFSATSFTKEECKQLDRIFRSTVLSKMGVCCKTSLHIVHGSFHTSGLQIPTCWDLQGATKLHHFMGHIQLNDLVGRLLSQLCDYTYLHIGLTDPLFSYNYSKIKDIIPPSWISNLWEFTSSIKAILHVPSLQLENQRIRDTSISSHAIQYAKGIELKRIKAVRMYLQVFFVSDIATSCGNHISQEYLYASKTRNDRTAAIGWPNQSNPPPKSWSAWRKFLTSTIAYSDFRLRNTLQQWLHPTHKTQKWNTVLNPETNNVFIKQTEGWKHLTPKANTRRILIMTNNTTRLPQNTVPISLKRYRNQVTRYNFAQYIPKPATIQRHPFTNFQDWLVSRPPYEQAIIGTFVHHSTPLSSLATALMNGELSIGSDGSARTNTSSFACKLLSCNDPATFIQQFTHIVSMQVYGTEALGHLAALYILRALTHIYPDLTLPFSIDAHIDNLGLIHRLQHGKESSISHTQQKFNYVLREIHKVEADIGILVKRHHVRSHQYDEAEDETTIPFPNQLNKHCDNLTAEAYNRQQRPVQLKEVIPDSTKTYILWQDELHINNVRQRFQFATHEILSKQYIEKRNHWDPTIHTLIDWNSIGKAFYRASSLQRKTFTKLSHKLWATNVIQHQRSNKRIDHRCHRCGKLHEDWDHVFKCKHPDNVSSRQIHLHGLRQQLLTYQFASLQVNFMIQGILNWLDNTIISPFLDNHPNDEFYHHLLSAYEYQSMIGWDQFLCGRLAHEWSTAHDLYVRDKQLSTSKLSNNAIPFLILALYDFGLKIWQQRNDTVFGATPEESKQKQQEHLNDTISNAYNDQELIRPDDQDILFQLPLPHLLQLTMEQKQNWITTYESCLESTTLETTTGEIPTYPIFSDPPPPLPPPVPNITENTVPPQTRCKSSTDSDIVS